ncbi:hypothetical protein AVL56_04340 [Alteromonas stellipolaris]|uniref:Alw26I/Eco31I/Esp3I family type II restriction endonuclease n=1 Tax=Alteromonas stellipolaris TaxID=233316 RepID=UPI0007703283|nr:Alw26I/Eco31I/Esp3I family type II restriction endonuclease [Alteromonas stellipolaris]AMJ93606.1 hypothetical protein AVL56_04340 [Alteromonas stellipolaris]
MSAEIDERPESYGSKGQNWHPEFVKYMSFIVKHEAYKGMPDAIKEDGKIQWEAPTNRSGGLYQFTNIKRKAWWEAKAKEIGLDTKQNKWISRAAKMIHPTNEKPCKRCGRVMKIAYVYPSATLIRRIVEHLGENFEIDQFETIIDIVINGFETYGDDIYKLLPLLLKSKNIVIPKIDDNIDSWLQWIETDYIPKEPSTLSPGVMSNPPDRFDGFHSFNKCCRGSADKGRHKENMSSYITDRRVFEYWTEGDWIAGDRLMGKVRTVLSEEECADGGEGPPSPDHIGPISLGFCHRPEFRLLSRSANSAKNNRMTLSDVSHLIECEKNGVTVCSWYAKGVWNLLKEKVKDEETALRISKILRDNQRIAGKLLSLLKEKGNFAFLAYLLELKHADFDVKFENLRSVNYLTVFEQMLKVPRVAKYAEQQKARRLRVGFEALESYKNKGNRHYFEIKDNALEGSVEQITSELLKVPEVCELNAEIEHALSTLSESDLRSVSTKIPAKLAKFDYAKSLLEECMDNIAISLSQMWDDDRYIRLIELDD